MARKGDDCIAFLNYPNKVHIIPGAAKFGLDSFIDHKKYYTLEFKLKGEAVSSTQNPLRGVETHLVEARWSEGAPGTLGVLAVRSSNHMIWLFEVNIPEKLDSKYHRQVLDTTAPKINFPDDWVLKLKTTIDLADSQDFKLRNYNRDMNGETLFKSSYVNGMHLNMEAKVLMVVFNTMKDAFESAQRLMVAIFYTLNTDGTKWRPIHKGEQDIVLPCLFDMNTFDLYENLRILGEGKPISLMTKKSQSGTHTKYKKENQIEFYDCLVGSNIQLVESIQTVKGEKVLNLTFIIKNTCLVYHVRLNITPKGSLTSEILYEKEPPEEDEKLIGLNYLIKITDRHFQAMMEDEEGMQPKVSPSLTTDA